LCLRIGPLGDVGCRLRSRWAAADLRLAWRWRSRLTALACSFSAAAIPACLAAIILCTSGWRHSEDAVDFGMPVAFSMARYD
jgi:hypothetical protein